ncbi:sensor histidine kinase [candidate division KSB1 bacterium]|nr:response regulator [candidate division KSB1 bacterium]RQW01069.1 MAG: sensor histidine kinase [candidate division KSB1 bacterium]
MHFLVEEEGYIVFFADETMTIRRIEQGEKKRRDHLNGFLSRPLFELFPELTSHKKSLASLFSVNNHLVFHTRLSILEHQEKIKITVLPYQDASGAQKGILLLVPPEETPQKKLLQQLQQERLAKQKARKATIQARRASTRFLANISHEIRTPMNGVIGMTSLLLATQQTPEQREYAEIIRTSGEALLHVINDILDYAKIESDHLKVYQEPFVLRTCVEECLDMFAARAAQKNIELAYSLVFPCPETIITDRAKLVQILNNLLSNAIKFTETGEIVITVRCQPHHAGHSRLFIEVQDSGIGIPRYAQNRIFEAFEQVQSSQRGHQGGTGLGLAITQRLVLLLGGSISVQSQLGKGSTFSFNILIDCPETADKKIDILPSSLFLNKRILVVDDNATNRRILQAQLEAWGITSVAAQDGAQALKILHNESNFDLTLLDMKMPGLDGLELAEKIRTLQHYQKMPLVLLTSVDGVVDKRLLRQYDISHYLIKPVKKSQMLDLLTALFAPVTRDVKQHVDEMTLDATMSERHPLRILVAEDNQVNQQFMQNVLHKLGYTPECVKNGELVLHALEQEHYDLIFMDIQMPGLDGVETARKINQQYPRDNRPYIIALTAHAMPGDREKFTKSDMQGYLSKPVTIDELVQALKNCCSAKNNRFAKKSTAVTAEQNDTIDLKHIKQNTGFEKDEDDKFIKELLETFLDETGELWEHIVSALAKRNFAQIYGAAHTIKSSSQMIGANRFAKFATDLAKPAHEGDYATVKKIVQEMREEKKSLFAAVQTLIASFRKYDAVFTTKR